MLARNSCGSFICLSCRQRLSTQSRRILQRTRWLHSSTQHCSDNPVDINVDGKSTDNALQSKRPSLARRPFRSPLDLSTPARTRFAPSPTGNLHLGSIRTALYNYLLARRTGGQFILRIEDTDARRTIAGAEARIIRDLEWAGMHCDEGPHVGGPHGPYRQSERAALYARAADDLLARGAAYRCFCSRARLQQRATLRAAGADGYDRRCLGLAEDVVRRFVAEGVPHVVRLKEPETSRVEPVDLTYGKIHAPDVRRLDGLWQDPILLKSDGLPTYHLANVVDDHYMEITHVIRGVEWLVSTRWHHELYQAFGWDPPTYAHVGLLLDAEGNKLSKREKSLDLNTMKEDGVLPEALSNFLVLLGWHHGEQSDFLPMKQMEKIFDLKFTKPNPTVALEKLWHLSPKHAQARADEGGEKFDELVQLVLEAVRARYSVDNLRSMGWEDEEKLESFCRWLLKANAKNFTSVTAFVESQPHFFSDSKDTVVQLSRFGRVDAYFHQVMRGLGINEDLIRNKSLDCLFPANSKDLFTGPTARLQAQMESIIEYFVQMVQQEGGSTVNPKEVQKVVRAVIYQFLRGWITWGAHGPSLAETMWHLGPDVVRSRIENVRIRWKNNSIDERSGEHRGYQESQPTEEARLQRKGVAA